MSEWSGAAFEPEHFLWSVEDGVATLTLHGPGKKNPLTFESYREIGETFRNLADSEDVRVVVITGSGGDFCSGGDVHDIIGPLTRMDSEGLLDFTRLTGELVLAMRAAPQPIISAVDGICVGAGAIVAMASDLRYGTDRSKVAFLFTRVGLSGADMGACAILPRIVGQGRASELLYTGRTMTPDEALAWGFYNQVVSPDALMPTALEVAAGLARGPTVAHATTKRCLHAEWDMGVEEAVEHEAREQARCMETQDFVRAYEAFARKEKPVFEGN